MEKAKRVFLKNLRPAIAHRPTPTSLFSTRQSCCLQSGYCLTRSAAATAPGKGRSHRIVPHRAHSGAGESGDPPYSMIGEQDCCDANISNRPNTADQAERKQSEREFPAC